MDFALAAGTKEFGRMVLTIYLNGQLTALANPARIHSMQYQLFPVHLAKRGQVRRMLRMQPIFKSYKNWYGR